MHGSTIYTVQQVKAALLILLTTLQLHSLDSISNCVDESNSLTVQDQHGIENFALGYFNLTTDPIT